ncbi:conserved hypothetical protein [Aspergillus fumigatus A1163]|uniref:Uncharacterized protein n=1 Tax=Aspergillus fumigatus (strain CBS 144.89 / FGSC A1163 / CEA10) TaxID=451804 RepID=B0XVM9_ASPFC|nr:conserved hypothetical protein [Aspergillus fumigatus A1163]
MIGELYKDKRENSAAFLVLGSSAGRSSIATIPLPSPHLRQALLACSNIACFGELGQVCCLRLCKSCRYIHSYLCCPQGTGPAESQCKRAISAAYPYASSLAVRPCFVVSLPCPTTLTSPPSDGILLFDHPPADLLGKLLSFDRERTDPLRL